MRTSLRIALCAATALTFGIGGSAVAAPARPAVGQAITGGFTHVLLDSSTVKALRADGIALSANGASTINKKSVLNLPVVGGVANQPYYVIEHSGGFTFTKGSAHVTINTVTFRTKQGTATGNMTGKAKGITVLSLGDPNRGGGSPTSLSFGGYPIDLAPTVAASLDKTFRTTVFGRHTLLGIGDTTVTHK